MIGISIKYWIKKSRGRKLHS